MLKSVAGANVLPSDRPESCWDGRLDGGPGLMGRDLQLMDEHVGGERGGEADRWSTEVICFFFFFFLFSW